MVTWQFHLMPQNCQQVPKDCIPINNHLLETNKIWIFFLKAIGFSNHVCVWKLRQVSSPYQRIFLIRLLKCLNWYACSNWWDTSRLPIFFKCTSTSLFTSCTLYQNLNICMNIFIKSGIKYHLKQVKVTGTVPSWNAWYTEQILFA